MKKIAIAMLAGTMWFTASMYGHGQGAGGQNRVSGSSRPCDKDGDGKCDTCGRTVGQGREQGQGHGHGHGRGQTMAARGGHGHGNGACKKAGNEAPAAPEKK